MDENDVKKLNELIKQIKEILPMFDAVMLSEESLILTSMENVAEMAEQMGYDIQVDGEEEQSLLEFFGMNEPVDEEDDDDNEGGTFH
jgi:bifunctional ADP-heptose synthase (sugar kinase/adenylyltransferase)